MIRPRLWTPRASYFLLALRHPVLLEGGRASVDRRGATHVGRRRRGVEASAYFGTACSRGDNLYGLRVPPIP
jgi:hypothetical protein